MPTTHMGEVVPVDPVAVWKDRHEGRTDETAIQGGCKFVRGKLAQYGIIPKLLLAQKFAAVPGASKALWEKVLPKLINAGEIDLVVDVPGRRVVVISGPGQPPDPMAAGPDVDGYHADW